MTRSESIALSITQNGMAIYIKNSVINYRITTNSIFIKRSKQETRYCTTAVTETSHSSDVTAVGTP